MKKFSFNTSGILALQLELFKLNDSELEEQGIQITENFLTFIESNFVLSKSQSKILKQIDQCFILEVAKECTLFIKKRQLINIQRHVNPINSPIKYSFRKLDMHKKSLHSFSAINGYQLSETLNFNIEVS